MGTGMMHQKHLLPCSYCSTSKKSFPGPAAQAELASKEHALVRKQRQRLQL